MAIIYFYTKKENVVDFLRYGIRLSHHFTKELNINGYVKQCICGLLNPKDDEYKYNSDEYTCLKLDIANEYCNVFDSSDVDDNTLSSNIVSINDYAFGSFKNPEVAITSSVLSEKISLLNKTIDVPVLFDNSRDLYYECKVREMLDDLSPKEAYVILKKYFDSN